MDLHKLSLSKNQYLKINFDNIKKNECNFHTMIDLDYIDEKKGISIRFGYDFFSSFCFFILKSGYIQKLLQGKMKLSNEIQDLGITFNDYFQGRLKTLNIDQYLCWSNAHKQIQPYFNSWLYNDKNGKVFFEITPFYSWHGMSEKSVQEKVAYKDFIKNYQVVIKTIVLKKNLKKWLLQTQQLLDFFCSCKGCKDNFLKK